MAAYVSTLRNEFPYILCTSTRCGLVGHHTHPFDQVSLYQPSQPHKTQRNGTVAADKKFNTFFNCTIDIVAVDGVENNAGFLIHP